MNELLNHIFLATNRANLNIGHPALGIISSVDVVNYAVKVIIQPEGSETGWIPLCTITEGWVSPPNGGEQCLVLFERGNPKVPIGALIVYWVESPAPGVAAQGDTQAGEKLLIHSSGAYVKLDKNGNVIINGHTAINTTSPTLSITTTGNATMTVGGNLSATVTGDANVTASGNATLKGTNVDVTGNTVTLSNGSATTGGLTLFQQLETIYNSHTHTDPQGGNTGIPAPQLTSSASTTIVQGA